MKLNVQVDLEFLAAEHASLNEYIMIELCDEIRLATKNALKKDNALIMKIKSSTEKYLEEHIEELIAKSCGVVVEGVVKKVASEIAKGNKQIRAAVVNKIIEAIG